MAYLAVIKTTVPTNVAVYSPSGGSSAAYSTCLTSGDILSSSATKLTNSDSEVTITLTLWKDKAAHDNFVNALTTEATARDTYNTANGITITKTTYVI